MLKNTFGPCLSLGRHDRGQAVYEGPFCCSHRILLEITRSEIWHGALCLHIGAQYRRLREEKLLLNNGILAIEDDLWWGATKEDGRAKFCVLTAVIRNLLRKDRDLMFYDKNEAARFSIKKIFRIFK